MIAALWSPIGRKLAVVGTIMVWCFGLYLKGRRDGKRILELEQISAQQRRVERAMESDNRVRDSIARGKLYDNDGHRRD